MSLPGFRRMVTWNNEEVCGFFLHNNRVGISGYIIYFLTCFVRIPAGNSMNPIIQTT